MYPWLTFAACARLVECLPSLQHDPNRPEDVLKVDADEDGVGGDDTADCLRYLVATKSRAVTQRKLRAVKGSAWRRLTEGYWRRKNRRAQKAPKPMASREREPGSGTMVMVEEEWTETKSLCESW